MHNETPCHWKLRPLTLLAVPAFISAVAAHPADADEAVPLPAVTVTADSVQDPSISKASGPATLFQVNNDGIDLWGGAGNVNTYRAISAMPSVNAQSPDGYGMANVPGGNKGLRVRGELATHGSTGDIDGIPVAGVNPGPGQQWLYDAENISSVSLAEGPVAPDRLSFFTTSGAINSNLRWPETARGTELAQSYGSFNFRRSFVRFDSGQFDSGSAVFVSGSHTSASKWRGPGDAPGSKDNYEAALSSQLGDHVNLKLYAAYNDMRQDNYRPLTYAQASNLGTYQYYDFSPTSSATASQAVNYYGYNRQSFEDWSLLSELTIKLAGDAKLVIKPFYQKENGYYLDGQTSGKVREWLLDHDSYGLTADYLTKIKNANVKVGYWWSSMVPPGPPTAWKMYTPTAAGDLSGAATWAILAKVVDRHQFNSLYAVADQDYGRLQVQGGLRYVRETMPGLDFYNTTGVGNLSYDQALAASSGVIAERSASSFSVGELLPFFAVAYDLTPTAKLKASLGRNYGAPSFDVWPVYQQNYSTFHASGITADQLWHNMKPETANAVDIGVRMTFAKAWIEPTIYYSSNHNKSVAYDPDGSGPLPSYSQNVADTRAWGAQATGNWSAAANMDVFGSLSWDNNVFSKDLPLNDGTSLAVSGLQLPDVPMWSANMGASWHQGAFTVSPVLRYTGSRYGDTQHTQSIPGFTTTDISLNYRHKTALGKLNATLTVANVFDKQYIGLINASYYQLMSSATAIYYPGAPRSIVASVALDF